MEHSNEIWKYLDFEPPTVTNVDCTVWRNLVGGWTQRGFLRHEQPMHCIQCPNCPNGESDEVILQWDECTNHNRLYVSCANCGPVEITSSQLTKKTLNVAAICREIASQANIKGHVVELVENRLWYLGQRSWNRKPRRILLARTVTTAFDDLIIDTILKWPTALVIAPSKTSVGPITQRADNAVVMLGDLCSPNTDGFTLDNAVLDRIHCERSMPAQRCTTRRSGKTTKVAQDTIAAIKFVKQHLIRAREYAWDTRQRTGTPELLPLEKKDIADFLKIARYRVSRCFSNEAGQELRMYFGLCSDIKEIMRFKSKRDRR